MYYSINCAYHLGHNRLHWSWPEARHRPWSISTYSEWLLGEIQQARPPKLAGGKWLPIIPNSLSIEFKINFGKTYLKVIPICR